LNNKLLIEEDLRIMNELIEEHVFGHKTTEALISPTIATEMVMNPPWPI
jgi:hypothetical protein